MSLVIVEIILILFNISYLKEEFFDLFLGG